MGNGAKLAGQEHPNRGDDVIQHVLVSVAVLCEQNLIQSCPFRIPSWRGRREKVQEERVERIASQDQVSDHPRREDKQCYQERNGHRKKGMTVVGVTVFSQIEEKPEGDQGKEDEAGVFATKGGSNRKTEQDEPGSLSAFLPSNKTDSAEGPVKGVCQIDVGPGHLRPEGRCGNQGSDR